MRASSTIGLIASFLAVMTAGSARADEIPDTATEEAPSATADAKPKPANEKPANEKPASTTTTTAADLPNEPAKVEGEKKNEPPSFKLPRCGDQESEDEFRTSTGCSGVFGIRGAVTNMRGAPGEPGASLTVSTEGEEMLRRRLFSMHGMHRLGIGGGSAGFDGTLLGSIAAGFRVPVGERHGPTIRAGVLGYLRGNDSYYGSLLEVPQLQAGYQYMRGSTVFEVGATTGVILVGRERTGTATRRILGDGFEVGAYAVAQHEWIRLGARGMRLPTNDQLASEVWMGEGTLCGIASILAVCADARVTQMTAFTDPALGARDVTNLHAGLSLGFTRERDR